MKKFLNKIVPKLYGTYLDGLSLLSKRKAAEKAFDVFCTVRKGRVLPKQRDYLDRAKHAVIEVQGHQLQTYHWPGKGDTVLLIHGWESNSFRWRNLVALLQQDHYNIVAFDAPAHGYSSGRLLYVPLYADSLQEIIGIYDPKYLVGHSVGGMTVLYNQYLYPNPGIEKIVTIGSPSEFHEILAHYQNLLGFGNRVLHAFERYIQERFGFEVRDFSSSRFVANSSKKGLLIHDKLDTLAPFHASENVHRNWRGSTFIQTEGLGHSLHQPHINKQLVDFLKS